MEKNRDAHSSCIKEEHIRVLITSAASASALHLATIIAQGETFGPNYVITLHLLDKPEKCANLNAIQKELCDCIYPHLRNILITCDPVVAFANIHIAFLLGIRRPDPILAQRETAHLVLFKDYGMCLNVFARKDCKVLVAAEPSNTLCYICASFASNLPMGNFSALSRLNQNRAVARIASELKVSVTHLKNIVIWGNLWSYNYVDSRFGMVYVKDHYMNIRDVLKSDDFLKTELVKHLETRDQELYDHEHQLFVISVAKAMSDQMHDWCLDTPDDTIISMAVMSDGSYHTPKDVVFSYPVTIHRGKLSIIKNMKLDEVTRYKIDAASKELINERNRAIRLLTGGDEALESYDMRAEINELLK